MGMRTRNVWVSALGIVACLLAAPGTAGAQTPEEPGWTGVWYLGGVGGYAAVEIPGRSMKMQGIDFTNVEANADDAGLKAFIGYHITDYVSLEWNASWLGHVTATFDYFDPPGERGTGETTVSMYSSGFSLAVGYRLRTVLLYARGGVQFWRTSYDTRFYLPDGTTQETDFNNSGNCLSYGAGALLNFAQHWSLRLEAEAQKMDLADVKVIALGLEARLW